MFVLVQECLLFNLTEWNKSDLPLILFKVWNIAAARNSNSEWQLSYYYLIFLREIWQIICSHIVSTLNL